MTNEDTNKISKEYLLRASLILTTAGPPILEKQEAFTMGSWRVLDTSYTKAMLLAFKQLTPGLVGAGKAGRENSKEINPKNAVNATCYNVKLIVEKRTHAE